MPLPAMRTAKGKNGTDDGNDIFMRQIAPATGAFRKEDLPILAPWKGIRRTRNEAAEKKFEWLKTLTKRERQIFALIATGHDNDEIAEELDLALQTVRNQVSTIYSKLGVKDRFEIIKLANKA